MTEEEVWFDARDGRHRVKNPDEEWLDTYCGKRYYRLWGNLRGAPIFHQYCCIECLKNMPVQEVEN